jgi:hypothetical protein
VHKHNLFDEHNKLFVKHKFNFFDKHNEFNNDYRRTPG